MFHYLYKTQCTVDGSAYTGIHSSPSISWGDDGNYLGIRYQSAKMRDKVQQYGPQAFRTYIIECSADLAYIQTKLNAILSPELLAHPLCLNQPTVGALPGVPKSPEHREAMALAKIDNVNAMGHVKSEETKAAISEKKLAAELRWIHNPETGEQLQIPKSDLPLLETDGLRGFVLGKLKKSASIKKRKTKPVANSQDVFC